MKVALFGGTGFVGNYIVDELITAGHEPLVLVRPGSEDKLIQSQNCSIFSGDVDDDTVMLDMMQKGDAVIYNIGIIRQFPRQGISFEKLHFSGVKKVIDLALSADVKRFILMSANGVKPNGTPYQTTKYLAEQLLKNSILDWTIFRPSLIFGDPRGNIEFCSQLKKDMIKPPVPVPLFFHGLNPWKAGSFSFTPVHVSDVAKIFVQALERKSAIGKVYEIGGNITISWKALVSTIATVCGKNKWKTPVPATPVKIMAYLLDRFNWFPITSDQLTMLMEGNTCPSKVFEEFEVDCLPFKPANLHYLQ